MGSTSMAEGEEALEALLAVDATPNVTLEDVIKGRDELQAWITAFVKERQDERADIEREAWDTYTGMRPDAAMLACNLMVSEEDYKASVASGVCVECGVNLWNAGRGIWRIRKCSIHKWITGRRWAQVQFAQHVERVRMERAREKFYAEQDERRRQWEVIKTGRAMLKKVRQEISTRHREALP